MSEQLHTISVPRVFYDDHVSRDNPNRVVDDDGKRYTLTLTTAERDELLSDARYYSTEWRHMDAGDGKPLLGLGASARATVRAIEAQS